MDRSGFFFASAACCILLFGCRSVEVPQANVNAVDPPVIEGVTVTDFQYPFDAPVKKWRALAKGCDGTKMMDVLKRADAMRDGPGSPFRSVHFCSDDVLVIESQSMWAKQEFDVLSLKDGKWYNIAVESAGRHQTQNDGGELLTDEECVVTDGCISFRAVHVSAGSPPVTSVQDMSVDSKAEIALSSDDIIDIIKSGGQKIYFHLGEERYVAEGGKARKMN